MSNHLQCMQVDQEKLMILNSNAKLEKWKLQFHQWNFWRIYFASDAAQTVTQEITMCRSKPKITMTEHCYPLSYESANFSPWLLHISLNILTSESNAAIQIMNDLTSFPTQASFFHHRRIFQEKELINPQLTI